MTQYGVPLSRSAGMTLVEVLIAITLLSVGVLALAGTAALVTRMIGRGHRAAAASVAAAGRLELLRLAACDHTAAGAGSHDSPRLRLAWTITDRGHGRRAILLVARHASTQSRWRVDTLETAVTCRP